MMSNFLSEHFTFREFACKHCGKIPQEIFREALKTCEVLESIRKDVKAPLIIASGYRCLEHNEAEKGDPLTRHLYGEAVDIVCATPKFKYQLVDSAMNHGILKIKIYPNHVHIETSQKYDDTCWLLSGTYDKSPK